MHTIERMGFRSIHDATDNHYLSEGGNEYKALFHRVCWSKDKAASSSSKKDERLFPQYHIPLQDDVFYIDAVSSVVRKGDSLLLAYPFLPGQRGCS